MKKIIFLLFTMFLVTLVGCKKKETGASGAVDDDGETFEEEKDEKISGESNAIPCVMLGDFYYAEDSEGGFTRSLPAIPCTQVQALPRDDDRTLPLTKTDAEKNTFVRVMLEDDMEERNLWAIHSELAVNAHPGCTYETGSDIFIFDKPDFNSQGRTKLLPDMLLAIYNELPSSDQFPDADKFQKIKIRLGNASTLIEGFLKNIQLDQSPERVSLIQVTKKYSELLESGNASNETLAELSDTIEELRQWSDRRW